MSLDSEQSASEQLESIEANCFAVHNLTHTQREYIRCCLRISFHDGAINALENARFDIRRGAAQNETPKNQS